MARSRSERAHRLVLDSAAKLFAERGIDSTSMDSIAETSGVSKATIYKHWPDKEALCLEVLSDLHGLQTRPKFATGNVRADLIAILSYRPAAEREEIRQRIAPHLMAYAARNPEFGKAWRARVIEPVRREITTLLTNAVESGQLVAGLDMNLSMALLLGPMMYQRIFGVDPCELPRNLVERVVDTFLRAHGSEAKTPHAKPAVKPRTAKREAAPGKHRESNK